MDVFYTCKLIILKEYSWFLLPPSQLFILTCALITSVLIIVFVSSGHHPKTSSSQINCSYYYQSPFHYILLFYNSVTSQLFTDLMVLSNTSYVLYDPVPLVHWYFSSHDVIFFLYYSYYHLHPHVQAGFSLWVMKDQVGERGLVFFFFKSIEVHYI